jgi:hypothetical protein
MSKMGQKNILDKILDKHQKSPKPVPKYRVNGKPLTENRPPKTNIIQKSNLTV